MKDAGALVARAKEQIKVQDALAKATELSKKPITPQLTGGEQLQASCVMCCIRTANFPSSTA